VEEEEEEEEEGFCCEGLGERWDFAVIGVCCDGDLP
jgi:hypothetical protein